MTWIFEAKLGVSKTAAGTQPEPFLKPASMVLYAKPTFRTEALVQTIGRFEEMSHFHQNFK